MEEISACPVCLNEGTNPFLSCVDYTVSKKSFEIVSCSKCGFKHTSPRPTEEEIGPYYKSEEYISHTNTNKGLVNSIYQLVRSRTLKSKFNLLQQNTNGNSLLDYGCGAGVFLDFVKQNGWKALGVEQDSETRNAAINNFDLDIISADQIKTLDKNQFDAITLWHVLEHVHRLDETINILKDSLKDDGLLVVAVPNPASHDAKHYEELWAAYDVPRHLYHFEPNNIKQLFSRFDMSVVKILPMKFDSFYVSMLSEKNAGRSLPFVKGMFRGCISNLKAKAEESFSSQIYLIRKNKAI